MTVTIYHNPKCSTSRKVLGLIEEAGIAPHVVDYVKTPLSRVALQELAAMLPGGARTLLRQKESLAVELGLTAADVPDTQILDGIAAHPVLFNRPIVVGPRGAAACRPPESVYDILPPRM